jgi:DNA-binding PadR family transcriptional regulator
MRHPADREIRLALWKLHILHHATRRPVYGLWLLEELASHGHRVSPGTLYPILERMERNGWLRSSAAARPNARRNYRITVEGRRVVDALRLDVEELHREVVRGLEPAAETTRAAAKGTTRSTRARGKRAAAATARSTPRRGRTT